MAYIAGKTLDDEIDPDQPMNAKRAVEIVRKIALALQDAHENGIVHRDLKPANVMMSAKGEPIVMDFGLAKNIGELDENESKLTNEGAVMGTPSYMSPEQVRGDIELLGPATDIYALGVILFEMLAGRRPYGGSMGLVMARILTAPVPPLREFRPDADVRLETLCQQAMAKEIAARPASMAIFAANLSEYLQHIDAVPVVATLLPDATFDGFLAEPEVPSKPDRKPKSPKWPIIVGAAVLGLILVVAGILLSVRTKFGEVVIELSDSTANVELKVDGDRIDVIGLDKPLTLTAGEHGLTVGGADFETVTKQFTVKKGDKQVVKVTLKPKSETAKMPPATVGARPIAAPVSQPATVVNRSAVITGNGKWQIIGTELVQTDDGTGSNEILFGDPNTTDFDLTVDMKSDGASSCQVLVRSHSPTQFETLFVRHAKDDAVGRRQLIAQSFNNSDGKGFDPNNPAGSRAHLDHLLTRPIGLRDWHTMKVSVRGDRATVTVNDEAPKEYQPMRHTAGRVGLRTFNGEGRFRNIKVTAPDGKIRFEGLPELPVSISTDPSTRKGGDEVSFEIADGVKMTFCWIPKGNATLGSPGTEKDRKRGEAEHPFATDGFWLAKTECTQSQWQSVMGENPSHFCASGGGKAKVQGMATGNFPVEGVSWDDTQLFLKKLNARDGVAKAFGKAGAFKLPHEDQWEYAYRGGKGNEQAFYWGDSLNADKANCNGDSYGTEMVGVDLGRTCLVGSYAKTAPHAWGLSDMSGNVYEWCDNLNSSEQTYRMLSGGSWDSNATYCRAAYRSRGEPAGRYLNVGFRLCFSLGR